MLKILVISEAISFPFDEGFKNIILNITQKLSSVSNTLVVTSSKNNVESLSDLNVVKIPLNKLFLSRRLTIVLRNFQPNVILYIPLASYTLNSFVRAKVLKLLSRGSSKVVLMGLQKRNLSFLLKGLLPFLKPDLLLLINTLDSEYFLQRNVIARSIPVAVDCKKFHSVNLTEKLKLREKYNLPSQKIIISHIGHLRRNRNLTILAKLQNIDDFQVLIVASASTNVDKKLKDYLVSKGIIILNKFLSEIYEIYQLSDIYVFPVKSNDGAVDLPLSIFEALACDLPIITTRFGEIPKYFQEDKGFKFFEDESELMEKVQNPELVGIGNYKKVLRFDWESTAGQIIRELQQL